MKLRHRLALAFAVASSASLVAARLVTIESFRRVQEYELDEGLRARARQEGNDVALVGRSALERQYDAQGEVNPLEQLVTYGALYRRDGTLVADTPSFAHAPTLSEIGIDARTLTSPATKPFDFRFRGSVLRGVVVDVGGAPVPERQFLLIAASRRDMDADAQKLLAVGWWVALAWLPLTLAMGWWFGRRMTHGIEGIVGAARRVTAGELQMPLVTPRSRDDEVAELGEALREMVGRLESVIQRERRFASHAAHELRSPLAALRGELELALRRPRSPQEYEGALGDALEDTNRLIDLAEDLLVVARLGGAAAEPKEELNASDLVRDAIAASLATARGAGNVEVDFDAADLVIRGSRSALVRMLRNLLDNAATHGGSTPVRVRVRVTPRGDQVAIAVEDDGTGVSAEDLERIFEHFHRGADARQESGAGLGLGIAREIARQHGGDIVLESHVSPTRFVVHLPSATGG